MAPQDPRKGVWQNAPMMPGPDRQYSGVAAVSERVVVVGGGWVGRPNDDAFSAVMFDTKMRKWTDLPRLPRDYRMANVAAVGDRLFVLGGYERKETLEFDFTKNAWVDRAPLPFAAGRGSASVAVWKDKIILAGGVSPGMSASMINTGRREKEVLLYDPATDKYTMLPDVPLARGYAMGAVRGDEFWVMGGSTEIERTAAVDVLDLTSMKWTQKKDMPKKLSSSAIAVAGDRFIIAGGLSAGVGRDSPMDIIDTTWSFDPTREEWTELNPMLVPRYATGGALVGNQFFVPGGVARTTRGPGLYAPTVVMESFTLPTP